MRKIRDVLRLKYGLGRSHREIAAILRISHSTVGSYVRLGRQAGVSWPLPDELDDARLEAALYPPTPPSRVRRPEPDWARVHRELARHKGVTLQLLWLEYREAHPDGYQYSRFRDRYREWRGRIDVVLRQVYRAGEKAFVDDAGPTVEITDRRTGEIHETKVFVGVLAASNHTFVDLTRTRSLPDWTASHVRMFEFGGGVPELVIPDNEKAAVRQASRYEPDVNRTYHDLAVHYGTAVLLAPLRNHRFFSLSEARDAIEPLLAALNERPFQKIEGSRRSLFDDLDPPALKPLPADRYEYAEWRKARVNTDYHIQADGRFYSVPHALARRKGDVRLGTTTVEIFHKHRRVAAHIRGRKKGAFCDRSGPYARRAPRPPRMDSVAPRPLGARDRTRDRGLREEAPREPAPPGAGLPKLPRPHALRPRLSRRTDGRRLPPRAGHRRSQLQVREDHPVRRPRPGR